MKLLKRKNNTIIIVVQPAATIINYNATLCKECHFGINPRGISFFSNSTNIVQKDSSYTIIEEIGKILKKCPS